MSSRPDTDPRLLEALASLNHIGANINRIGPGGQVNVAATLSLIVDSAIRVVPGAAAVIYTYDQESGAFDMTSRVSAGERVSPPAGYGPRSDGLGRRAIDQRRRVISYEEQDLETPSLQSLGGPRAAVCFPLIVTEQPVGTLYVYLFEEQSFTQLELLMLENFVNQAAMAIYHTQQLANVQRDLTRKEDELTRLRRAGLLISSRPRLKETFEAILQMALDVTDAQYGILRLVDKSGENLITQAIAGEHLSRPLVEALPIRSVSVMGWVALHRQPLRIADLNSGPWNEIYYPLDRDLQMHSELAVPLINASGRLEGVLNLESPTVGGFSEQDSRLLQALAAQAVIAIQEVRLLDALQDVAMRLLTQPRQQVLDRLVELACDLLNAAASVVWLLEKDALNVQAASAVHPRSERVPLHGSLAGQAILCRCPVTSNDVREDERFNRRELARAQGWTRALVVPILSADDAEPVGAFSVYSTEASPGNFAESEWDNKVLHILAHYAALAIHNAARQEALQVAQEQRSVAETFAAIGDIAANLLHNLNNKVGTIPVRIQGIQDKCQPVLQADPYLANNLNEIESSALEAMTAVRDNLYHLRPIHLVPVRIAACIAAAATTAALPPGIAIQAKDVNSLPPVMAAERSLSLVFANLLDNAAAAMQGRGTIEVWGQEGDGWVEVALHDNGPGIAPELHDRIFELNFSGRSASRPGKLGFGLWWVKTLMARLGGSVSVESDGEHGTTFRVRLPKTEGHP